MPPNRRLSVISRKVVLGAYSIGRRDMSVSVGGMSLALIAGERVLMSWVCPYGVVNVRQPPDCFMTMSNTAVLPALL